MTTDTGAPDLARSTFRTASIIHACFIAGALAALVAIVVLIALNADGMSGFGTLEGTAMAAFFAVLAAGELLIGPRIADQVLQNPEPAANAMYPAPFDQLMRATLLKGAFSLAIGVYGLVLAIIWQGVPRMPFCFLSLAVLVLQRPQWHEWSARAESARPGLRAVR